jgi:glyoxylase-like metal-dependent hydrolase (beta-lactamase superfamily II)/8-oxo-dGTP pyrophosphatase MutT (NUDIX family)
MKPSNASPPPPGPGSTVTQAASVLLARAPGAPEVFLVGRAANLRFLGGFTAFPGGKVHPEDASLARDVPGLCVQRVAAVRELFEETGVLLARLTDGSFPPGGEVLARLRRQLLAEELTFPDLLAGLRLRLHPGDLTAAGALVTPEFAPIRFDTAFFVADLPPGQDAEVWPGELTGGTWQTAEEALAAWTAGATLLSPPTVSLLEVIRGRPVQDLPQLVRPLLDALTAGTLPPIWFSPAVKMIPLHCQGLPPSTHTNAYLAGTGPRYLFDPGPTAAEEQRRLFEVLDAHPRGAGRPLDAVVLTHRHPDHVGAAAACARRYGVPVLAHPLTARALAGKVTVDRELSDGAHLDLGPAPDGNGRWHLEAVHTPGHAAGHLAFYEPRYGLLFAGDMVSTLSSIIIAPPEGDLAVYLDSLRRLQAYPARLLLPAHGPPSSRPAFLLNEALAHRATREEQLLQALGAEPRTLPAVTLEVYRGLPANLMPLAELQTLAGLRKLQREGRATETATPAGPGWVGRPSV